jgi:hypothetical protein
MAAVHIWGLRHPPISLFDTLNDERVHIQNVERQNVERQNIERQNVEYQNVDNYKTSTLQNVE